MLGCVAMDAGEASWARAVGLSPRPAARCADCGWRR